MQVPPEEKIDAIAGQFGQQEGPGGRICDLLFAIFDWRFVIWDRVSAEKENGAFVLGLRRSGILGAFIGTGRTDDEF
jgi:hypothetical protein